MTKSFEFHFDFGSPASYLAWTQLPKLMADTGAQADYRPMLLGGVFQAIGNQSPAMIPSKGKYTFADFQRHAKRYGVPFNMNPHFPVNTMTLMRGATALKMKGDARLTNYCDAVFKAMWVDAHNMSDPSIVSEVLGQAGFDAAAMLALANEQTVKDQLKAATQEAVARGVFGAPTFFVGDQLFWGQDRIEWVREALG